MHVLGQAHTVQAMTDEGASSAWHSIWLTSMKEAQGSRRLTGPAPSGSRESTSSCSVLPAHEQGVLCMTCVTDCTCCADHAPWQPVWWWPGRWHPEPPSCALRHPGGERHKLPGLPSRRRSFTQNVYIKGFCRGKKPGAHCCNEKAHLSRACLEECGDGLLVCALCHFSILVESWKEASASARTVSALVSDISDRAEGFPLL